MYMSPDARLLRQALDSIFIGRNAHPLPAGLPTPPDDWKEAYKRLASGLGIEPDVMAGYRRAVALLDPVLAGALRSGAWLPAEGRWSVEG